MDSISLSETSSVKSIKSLSTIDLIEALHSIGIYSIRDLAEHQPCRYSEILTGFVENGNIDELILEEYLTPNAVSDINDSDLNKIPTRSITSLTCLLGGIRANIKRRCIKHIHVML